MNKKEIMYNFINEIKNRGLLTKFIKLIFNYDNFNDYNYIFRIFMESDRVVMDIYDNISDNRFNRYVFFFDNDKHGIKCIKEGNVYVTYINVLNISDGSNYLSKLAYLFKLDKEEMFEYANTFLEQEYIDILKDIIK